MLQHPDWFQGVKMLLGRLSTALRRRWASFLAIGIAWMLLGPFVIGYLVEYVPCGALIATALLIWLLGHLIIFIRDSSR